MLSHPMETYPVDTYQIGIICALPKELKAVRAILDEEHAPLQNIHEQDHNSYILGRVGQHNVVAAGLPAGVYGTTSAVSVSKDMLRTFAQLRFGLLVGIGGGVPNPKGNNDVRLGDVVMSQPDAIYGGVVQYDLGKLLSDGTFERKGSLNKPPLALLTALTNLKASLDNRNVIADYLTNIDAKYPFLKEEGYTYPGLRQDRLHCTRCDTSRWWWFLWVFMIWLCPLWRCDECDSGQVRRASRLKTTPAVHYGTIASANVLLKNAQKRNQLRAETGALCVEMEAAGLMDNFPCLVVRGICDYADAQKDDAWQEYAALTAAVFAKQLLGYVSPQTTEREEPALKVLSKLDQYLKRQEAHHIAQEAYHQRQDIRYQTDRHRDCHRIFKTCEYQRHKNINPEAVPGTCHWVYDHPRYQSWLDSTNDDLLWISADPGCGKSVLSKSLIDVRLHRASTISSYTICYFFFKDNEQQNSLSTALCAILHQLFSDQPALISHALSAFDQNGERLQRDTDELWRILQAATSDVTARPVICVIDALDECRDSDRKLIIDLLCQSYKSSRRSSARNCLKWLATSRPYDDIHDHFQKVPPNLSIRLRGEDMSDKIEVEINLVIRERMNELSQELALTTAKTDEVLQQLLSMKHRTYLWLYLAINAIRDSFRDTIWPSEQTIISVPDTVEDAYERILARVTTKQKEYAMTVLTIIIGAQRPLTVHEMALALNMALSPQAPTILTDLGIDAQQLGTRIRRWCGLFVFISGDRIYLLHQTAREFLLSYSDQVVPIPRRWKFCLSLLEVEKKLATICIRYLCLSDFDNPPQQREDVEQQDEKESATRTFFDFAAEHWAGYTRPIEKQLSQETRACMQVLHNVSSERWRHWTSVMWKTMTYNLGDIHTMDCVHLAAFNGHTLLLSDLLQASPEKVDLQDGKGRTSLIWASERGFSDTVRTLLAIGAEVNAQGGEYGTALRAASAYGHEKVVQILLDKDANVNAQGGEYGTALRAASASGHDKVVQILLDKGADVNAQGGAQYGTALQVASAEGHDKVVQMLLDKDADVNAQGGESYGSALQAASVGGHVRIVQMLLSKDANVNAQGAEWYSSALQAASAHGHSKVVQILLDKDANVNTQGGEYGTALRAASVYGYVRIVQMLLSKGADVNAQGRAQYGTALQVASAEGHDKVVQMLLDKDADVNAQGGGESKTALHAASANGYDKVVQMLLDKDADVDAQGGEYGTALQTAAVYGHYKVVQILLDKGADVDARGRYHRILLDEIVENTALQAASAYGHEKVVQILLDKGADVNARGRYHRISLDETMESTAVQAASAYGHEEIVQILLDKGADVDAQGGYYGTALQAASKGGHEKVVQILLDKDADVNIRGKYPGRSLYRWVEGDALQAASEGGHEKIVQMLYEHGATDMYDHVREFFSE